MGTRDTDQPAEHWAAAESLDPTPVWKQYALVALLLVVGLVVVVVVALTALAPSFATPPALVFGDRLVLAAGDIPAVGAAPKLIAAPLVDDARSFFLTQPEKGRVLALRAHWTPQTDGPNCAVFAGAGPSADDIERNAGGNTELARSLRANAAVFAATCPGGVSYVFNATGERARSGANPEAPRGLDQYLVSVSGDRVIVNLSRLIESSARTVAPVPTGIPQPQQTP